MSGAPPDVATLASPWFTIPMRGNEGANGCPIRSRSAATMFTIPMRGNEQLVPSAQ